MSRLIISAIVLAEMYYANQKKQWFEDFSETVRQLSMVIEPPKRGVHRVMVATSKSVPSAK